MCRRTDAELDALFEKKGFRWVREQLLTNGGEINMLESPHAKVWVEDQKEKFRKAEKKEEKIVNLIFLLVGALISAFVSFLTTKAQLERMNRQHQETIKQQQLAIEDTFRNGINLMLLQYRTESELRFLSQIYNAIENDFEPIFFKIHNMRNNWKEQLVETGRKEYLQKLLGLIDETSNAIKNFDKLLKRNSQHVEIYAEFNKTLSFQSNFFNPINDLYRAIEIFPDGYTVGNLKILDDKGENFSKAVDLLSKWMDDVKVLAQKKQQEIFKLSQERNK